LRLRLQAPLVKSGIRDRHFRLLFDDAAVEAWSLRSARIPRVVRDHADGRAGAVQLAEQVHDRFAAARVEVAGRLVGQQDERLAGDGARHRDALLLTARELAGEVLGPVRHADALERGFDALLALGGLHAAIGERQLDVLEDGEVANQVEALEDEPDLAVAHARPLGRRELGDRPVVQQVLSFGGGVEQAENRQQRRLAAARWPGDRDVFAFVDLEVDPRQGMGLDFVGEEDLRHTIELDQRLSVVSHLLVLLAALKGCARVISIECDRRRRMPTCQTESPDLRPSGPRAPRWC
jgi:hypothetical protein